MSEQLTIPREELIFGNLSKVVAPLDARSVFLTFTNMICQGATRCTLFESLMTQIPTYNENIEFEMIPNINNLMLCVTA